MHFLFLLKMKTKNGQTKHPITERTFFLLPSFLVKQKIHIAITKFFLSILYNLKMFDIS